MDRRIPSLNWLRVFEAAARCESFARAASGLNMSAAAVSQQVRALEDHLGTPLFLRHAHAVTLTEAGRAYLPSVQQALALVDEATDGIFGAARTDPLFVQSVLIFAHGILARGLADFQERHPRIRLNLSTGNAPEDFRNRFSDLRIVFGTPSAFGAAHDTLIGETLFPVAPPERSRAIDGPADLLDHPAIEVSTHRAGWRHMFDHLRLSGRPRAIVHADNSLMAAEMAAQGLGLMLARAPATDAATRAAGLVPCLPGVTVAGIERYHLVYPDAATLRPAARMFRTWLLDHVAALR